MIASKTVSEKPDEIEQIDVLTPDDPDPGAQVPEPGTLLLTAMALVGLGVARQRRAIEA